MSNAPDERGVETPRVTIGIPAYNNEKTIAACLESIMSQTMGNFCAVISDDNSTDMTWDTCSRYPRIDRRFKAIRQDVNLYYLNFLYVLETASTPYFVWLAADDRWAPTYLERCVAILDSRPDVVACVARCQFVRGGVPVTISSGTEPLLNDWEQNVRKYLHSPNDNSRMYGVFRTEALQAAFPRKIMHAYDWALMAATLKYGKHFEIPELLMIRDHTPREAYFIAVRRDSRRFLFRLFPVLQMSLHITFRRQIPLTRRIIAVLAALNWRMHEDFVMFAYPAYYRFAKKFYILVKKYILWRA